MMNDYVYPWDGFNVVVRLNNIPPGRYDILVYGVFGQVGAVNGKYKLTVGGTPFGDRQTIPGANWTALNWTDGEHYVCYPSIKVTTGQQIVIEAMRGADVAIINGIQLVKVMGAPPQISPIPDQVTSPGVPVGPLTINVSDLETTDPNDLTVTAHSENLAVIPESTMELTCCETRTLKLVPSGQTGSARIEVAARDDDANTTKTAFFVTVAVNTPPTISSFSDITIDQNSNTGALSFTVGDSETPAASLAVSASVGNSALLPSGSIAFGGSGANRTLTITPASNVSGSSTVTVTVTDGGAMSASRTFTVHARLPITGFITQFNADHSSVTNSATSQTGATVRYTTDGTDPTQTSSTVPPVITSSSAVVKARAFQSGYAESPVLTSLPIGTTAAVTFSPNGHNPIEYSNGPLAVQMSAESGAAVSYKSGTSGTWLSVANGTSASINGIDSGNGTIQAYAFTGNKFRSATSTSAEFSFRIPQPMHTISYNSGNATLTLNTLASAFIDLYFNGSATVSETLTANASGVATRTFSAATKVKAKARKAGYIDSGLTTAHVNKLPPPKIATMAGVSSQDVVADNSIDIWLIPNFGFDNVYGEYRSTAGWGGPMTWSADVPNADFPGAFFASAPGNVEYSANLLGVSYARSFSWAIWMKGVNDGGSYAGLLNYNGNSIMLNSEDINEGSRDITWLTAPLVQGATTAFLANEQIFAPVSPEYYFNFFTPLHNFARGTAVQQVNQPWDLRYLYQSIEPWSGSGFPHVTSVSAANKSVTLGSAYQGPNLPTGAVIARRAAGSTYQYELYTILPSTWTKYQGTSTYMRPGTEQIALMLLLSQYGGNSGMTGFEFWEGTAGQKPKLYYSINGGSELQAEGPKKLTLDAVGGSVTLSVRQKGANYFDSDTLTRSITFKVSAPKITSRLEGGAVLLSVKTATVGDQIYYTTDGTEPNAGSTPYTEGSEIAIPTTATTRWKAFKSNYASSETVTKLALPIFNPPGGTYNSGQTVTITAPTGAQLTVHQPNANMLNPALWASGVAGAYPSFNAIGHNGEDSIEVRKTPYGTMENVWIASNADIFAGEPGNDGGWNASFSVDQSKLYRISMWVRKLDSTPVSSSGFTYLGCGWNDVSDLTGTGTDTVNGNPYFWYGHLPPNEWHLVVGYVHPAGHLGTSSSAKLYNTAGQVVASGADFRWRSTTTYSYHRAYLYYCTEAGIQQEFWNPRAEIINSVNDPIDVLLVPPESSPKTITVETGRTIQALSYSSAANTFQSDVAVSAFSFKVSTPVITSRIVGNSVILSAANGTPGDHVYYSTDGSEPTTSSTSYSEGAEISFPATTTTKWKAFRSNYAASDTVTKLGVPTLSPPGGTYNSGQTVTITAANPGIQLKVHQPNPNILDPALWASGVAASYPIFEAIGHSGEDSIEIRKTPYGTMENVWIASNGDTFGGEPGNDGGWHAPFSVDPTKLYRMSVWLRKLDSTSASTPGSSYFGCGWNDVSDLTGTATDVVNANPYFMGGLLPPNEWYLAVGYVHPAGHTGTMHHGRVYSTQGAQIGYLTDFRWRSTTTYSYHRAYLYYCTEAGVQQEFWNPRVEIINSVNDPVDVLLVLPENSPKVIALNGSGMVQALSYGSGSFIASDVVSSSYTITNNPDSDNDGLLDSWEMQHFGNIGQNPHGDWDADGVANIREYQLGTSPTSEFGLELFTPLLKESHQ